MTQRTEVAKNRIAHRMVPDGLPARRAVGGARAEAIGSDRFAGVDPAAWAAFADVPAGRRAHLDRALGRRSLDATTACPVARAVPRLPSAEARTADAAGTRALPRPRAISVSSA
ncbi:MAG: hypothetical protein L6R19_21885 [Alphaproteobacteria bacterium]|nr:hypothetical protein [Alphaproteobacteria bacterium]